MKTSREFHDEAKRWRQSLPPRDEKDGDIHVLKQYHEDLNGYFRGKRGVQFNLGTCMYEVRTRNDQVYGFVNLLSPQLGVLFTALDDIQAMGFPEASMTKSLEMNVHSGFVFGETLSFVTTNTSHWVTLERLEITTVITLRSMATNAIVASGSALFIQNAATRAIQVQADNREELWDLSSPYRLAGTHMSDPLINYTLQAPIPTTPPPTLPSWWTATTATTRIPRQSPFATRFHIQHLQQTTKPLGVRAMVLPMATSEGAPGKMHGGAASCALFEVLENVISLSCGGRELTYKVRFRSPVTWGTYCVIEWKQSESNCWSGAMMDLDRNVLQEVVLEVGQKGRL